MLTLTTFEKSLRRILVARARAANGEREKGLITYSELGDELRPIHRAGDPALDYPFGGFYEAIGHVSSYEVEHGRPMLSALVVTKETRTPGPGFAKLALHLGFEFADAEEFWADEIYEVLWVWGDDTGTEVLDGAVEVLDDRMRSIRRTLRMNVTFDGPYLVRIITNRLSTNARPATISIENVGTRPAVDGLYFGLLPSGMLRTEIFHMPAGMAKQFPLVPAQLTYGNNSDVMGELDSGAAEVLICGHGTGRWSRIRPSISQKPDYWSEGSQPPDWMVLYRELRRAFERG
jgi:hypothetical protein